MNAQSSGLYGCAKRHCSQFLWLWGASEPVFGHDEAIQSVTLDAKHLTLASRKAAGICNLRCVSLHAQSSVCEVWSYWKRIRDINLPTGRQGSIPYKWQEIFFFLAGLEAQIRPF
jgi:hypothetical protein